MQEALHQKRKENAFIKKDEAGYIQDKHSPD